MRQVHLDSIPFQNTTTVRKPFSNRTKECCMMVSLWVYEHKSMKNEYSKFKKSALRATKPPSNDCARLSTSPSTETLSRETLDSSGCYGSRLPSGGGEDVRVYIYIDIYIWVSVCVWSLGVVVADTKVSVTDFRVLTCSRHSWRVQSEYIS